MLYLVAQGPAPRQRWRNQLVPGTQYLLGRDVNCDFPVPWDPAISSRHATVSVQADGVQIRQLSTARNPIYFQGHATPEFILHPDQHCVIGTTSLLLQHVQDESPSPVDAPFQEFQFSEPELRQVRFEDADRRMEVLAKIPGVISEVRSRTEMAAPLLALLLAGIRQAEAAAIVTRDRQGQIGTLRWDRRSETDGAVRPSTRLIREAFQQRRSILHVWQGEQKSPARGDYTASAEFDWAFCTPVRSSRDEAWGMYVAGRMDGLWVNPGNANINLRSDIRFTELVAEIIASVERQNSMEGQLSVLRQFLSPPILSALESTAGEDGLNSALLEPRECDVTVLFCDLRGFSQRAEESKRNLRGLLDRVSAALEVMTSQILKHGGVTGDFLGDAVLGFWGWPFGSEEAPLKACRAALGIRQAFGEFHAQPDHPLHDFHMGIGIAHGRAVAGKIGTKDRVSVTVFGPVVNLASRLEGLTRRLHAGIVLDEATAQLVRGRLSSHEGRFRKLARVLPYGLESPLTVTELLLPKALEPTLSDEHLQTYERGVEAFIEGRWNEAYQALHSMPANDRAQDFLLSLIAQHNRQAPLGWRGVVELSGK